jgi:hypothetical protein
MEAYAELVAAVSKTLSKFTEDTFGTEEEYIRNFLSDKLTITPNTGTITDIKISTEVNYNDLVVFFAGILKPHDTDPDNQPGTAFDVEFANTNTWPLALDIAKFKVFVTQKMTSQAADTKGRLEALLKLGMQKLVIEKGEIYTKLIFHVDSHQTSESSASGYQNSYSEKISNWGAAKPSMMPGPGNKLPVSMLGRKTFGRAMVGSISANAGQTKTLTNLNVKVVNEKSTSATNLSIDIIGSVKIEFKTDYFPSFIPDEV